MADAPTVPAPPLGRCALHPGRPAADSCPRCGRPRCAADGASPTAAVGCAGCLAAGGPGPPARPGSGRLAALTRAALVCTALGLIGGALGLEYVGAQYFSVIWPGLVGAACGAAAVAAGRRARGARLLAVPYALLGAAYAFRFAQTAFGPAGRWVPPLVAAAVGPFVLPALDAAFSLVEGRSGSTGRAARRPNTKG